MGSGGVTWGQVVEVRWCQVVSGGVRWYKGQVVEVRWCQVGSGGRALTGKIRGPRFNPRFNPRCNPRCMDCFFFIFKNPVSFQCQLKKT